MALARSDLLGETNPNNGTFGFGTGACTSSSITTVSSSLLVVVLSGLLNGGTSGLSAALTCAGGSLTYTKQVNRDSSAADPFSSGIAIFTAPVTTGASFTLTLDAGALDVGQYNVSAHCYTGYDTSTPVGAAIGSKVLANDGADSITLAATPAATSEVIGGRVGGVATTGTVAASPGTNHTEVYDLSNTDQCGMQVQVQNIGTASTTFSWADVSNGTAGAGMGEMSGAAIEIREAPGVGGLRPYVFVPVVAVQRASRW